MMKKENKIKSIKQMMIKIMGDGAVLTLSKVSGFWNKYLFIIVP